MRPMKTYRSARGTRSYTPGTPLMNATDAMRGHLCTSLCGWCEGPPEMAVGPTAHGLRSSDGCLPRPRFRRTRFRRLIRRIGGVCACAQRVAPRTCRTRRRSDSSVVILAQDLLDDAKPVALKLIFGRTVEQRKQREVEAREGDLPGVVAIERVWQLGEGEHYFGGAVDAMARVRELRLVEHERVQKSAADNEAAGVHGGAAGGGAEEQRKPQWLKG